MKKQLKLSKDNVIEYDKVEIDDRKEIPTVTVTLEETAKLQADGWIVMNVYRQDGIKYYTLIKQ